MGSAEASRKELSARQTLAPCVTRRFQARERPGAAHARAIHEATAEFTKAGPDGTLVTEQVSLDIGNPGEAYVLIPPEIGYALQASGPPALNQRPDRLTLRFFHDTQHFALGTGPPLRRDAHNCSGWNR